MRKIASVLACAVMLLPVCALASCKGSEERTSYTVSARFFPEERRLSAEMRASVYNGTDNAWEALSFTLYPNVYREGAKYGPVSDLYAPSAYYGGKSYGGVEIEEVGGAASFTVEGEDDGILRVMLKDPLYPGERADLSFTFEVALACVNHRLGVGEHTVNLSGFFPTLCAAGREGFFEYVCSPLGDSFVSECADYDVTLLLPDGYVAAGAAEEGAGAEGRVWRYRGENVRDVAFVLGTDLRRLTTEADGIPVSYYYFDDPSPEAALGAAAKSLSYYAGLFTPYAYPSYTVVQTDFPYGGMEFSGLAMISADLRAEEAPFVIAHETAHQWWYSMVGSNQFEEAWQDEGLAEYSVALFAGAHPEYGRSYSDLVAASERAYRAFYSVYSQVVEKADARMSRPLTAYTGDYEYRCIAYDKGVILFDRLYTAAGEKKFLNALRLYAKEYGGKIASPADLIACFEKRGVRSEELFASFLQGTCVI